MHVATLAEDALQLAKRALSTRCMRLASEQHEWTSFLIETGERGAFTFVAQPACKVLQPFVKPVNHTSSKTRIADAEEREK